MLTHTLSSLKKFFNPIKRPKGPSFFQINDAFLEGSESFSLDFPVKLAEQCGDLIYSSAFSYMAVGPSIFEHILKTNAKNYIRGELIIYKQMKLMFGNSILVNKGEAWRSRRRMALPAYQHQTIQNYIPFITQCAANQLQQWTQRLPSKMDLLSELNQLTLNIAFKLFGSQEIPQKTLKFLGKAIAFSNSYCTSAFLIAPWKPTINNMRFYWYTKKVNQFFLSVIQKRRQESAPKDDLLQLLLNAKNDETQQLLTDQEVLAEFKTHIITGHETTACGLTWMWYLLAQHPHYRTQMEAELDEVLGGRLPTAEDIPNLSFTKAVISETFRLYPPIWALGRVSQESDEINGFEIPPHSKIILHLYALHRNPNYWEKPNDFYPERFLESDSASKRHPFLYLPFGSGPHTCIASHLGLQEAILLAATLGQRIRFNLLSKAKVKRECNISLKPLGGIMMKPGFRT